MGLCMKIVRHCFNGNGFLFNGVCVIVLLMIIGGALTAIALPFEQWYIQDLTTGVPALTESHCQRLSDVI